MPQPASASALGEDPLLAARDADLIVTDVWASMGQEEEQAKRERAFSGFQVNSEVMAQAASDALFMHCLPAHRGEEVTAEVHRRAAERGVGRGGKPPARAESAAGAAACLEPIS